MRLHPIVALGVFSLAACGSSTNSGPAGKGGATGAVSQGGSAGQGSSAGRDGSTGILGNLGGAVGTGGAVATGGVGAVGTGGAVIADGGLGSKDGAADSTSGAAGSTGGAAGSIGGASGSPAGGSSGTGGARNQSCSWLADCLAAASCSDEACVAACALQASNTAISQYTALIDCVAANPQCTTSDCLAVACASEITACMDSSVVPIDGGAPGPADAGITTGDAGSAGTKDSASDGLTRDSPIAPDVSPSGDADAVGPGPGQGYTTSGSCDIVTKIPGIVDSHTCWDYTLAVTTNHNDGTEHYVAYTPDDVAGTQSACTSQSYSARQPGPWDSPSLSASNLSHKKQACDLSGTSYGTTATWTEGGVCTIAGSLGHCTDAVTNAWDPTTLVLSSSLVGVWSVP